MPIKAEQSTWQYNRNIEQNSSGNHRKKYYNITHYQNKKKSKGEQQYERTSNWSKAIRK